MTRRDLDDALRRASADAEVSALLTRLDVRGLNRLREANLLRLLTILERGGVWLDAHCICTAPLSHLFDFSDGATFQGWTTFGATVDNWAFACGAGHPFVRAWLVAYLQILVSGTGGEAKRAATVGHPELEPLCTKYFWMYWASHAARRAAPPSTALSLRTSSSRDAPLWYCDEGYEALFAETLPALIKLDKTARQQLRLYAPTRKHATLCRHVGISECSAGAWRRIVRPFGKSGLA